jgi:Flp pilus assembly protein TadD
MISFQLAQKQNPYNRFIINDLATCYALKKNYSNAEILYNKAAFISPRYDDAILNLISLYITTNNLEKARFWEVKLCHESLRRSTFKSILYSQKKYN